MDTPINAPQTVFEIPGDNMAWLGDKIEKLNRKAKRLKVEPITTRVLGTRRVQERICLNIITLDSAPDVAYENVWRTYYSVEVLGIAPHLPDWEFLGTLEHCEAGNILRTVPGFEIPDAYRTGKQKCDHCETRRGRKDTYIVRSKTTGEVKQIGRQCVSSYLGSVSPQKLAMWAESLNTLLDWSEGGEGSEGRGERSVHPLEFMDLACEAVLQLGFVSKAAVQAYAEKADGSAGGLETTANVVWRELFPSTTEKKMMLEGSIKTVGTPSERARALAAEVLDWVKNLEPKDNYIHNLKMTFSKEFFVRRDAGLASSAVGTYQKHLGQLAKREQKPKYGENSKHFGEIKKREVFTLTVLGQHVFDSQFGQTVLFRLVDANGNLATWFTGQARLEVGKTYLLKATVKKHDQYKGMNQTVLTRCAVEKEL